MVHFLSPVCRDEVGHLAVVARSSVLVHELKFRVGRKCRMVPRCDGAVEADHQGTVPRRREDVTICRQWADRDLVVARGRVDGESDSVGEVLADSTGECLKNRED